ncbi:flagellar motor switch protein FliN/FliY [Chitinivorax tropicus]|uniref:Flagellar motor switch protein FliN n=1 Tax=Chitinivorax tropicus TaxID=714531 RepID=A0A840MNS8_9PROT|nr:FliM/FliN family flagellar motor switch protein [Chitinivorax tropicus]MBB5020298.1 flagellar motor switch protein FliN/FliY [Chitinivorax tropicus]
MSDNNDSNAIENTTQLVDLPELKNPVKAGASLLGSNATVIRNVKVRLAAQIGNADLLVSDLMQMKEDTVVKLDRLIDEPVDLILDDHVIARGQLVAVGDHFGVRITELPQEN